MVILRHDDDPAGPGHAAPDDVDWNPAITPARIVDLYDAIRERRLSGGIERIGQG